MDSHITKYFKVIKPSKRSMNSQEQNHDYSKTDVLLIDNLIKKNVVMISIYSYKYLTFFSKKENFSKINALTDKFPIISKSYLLKFVKNSSIELDSLFNASSLNKKKIIEDIIIQFDEYKSKYPVLGNIDLSKVVELLECDNNTQSNLKEIAFKMNIKYTTLYKAVREILLYRHVKCNQIKKDSNSFKNTLQLLFFVEKLLDFIDKGHTFIFFDESTFNNRKRTSKRWINKFGKKRVFDDGRIKSVNLLLAITNSFIIHSETSTYNCDFNEFQRFINQMIYKIEENEELLRVYNDFKITLIIDNISFHRNKEACAFYKTIKLNILTFPPYNPFFNPVEYIFQIIKKKFYKLYFSKM